MHYNILEIFQGVNTLLSSSPLMLTVRLGLIALGMLLVYLGKKGVLEPLLMVPMGLGMSAVNAAVLFLDPETARNVLSTVAAPPTQVPGTLFVAPLVEKTESLMYLMQVDFLQPIYTFAFSNGLIACFVFMGIGVLLDVGYMLQRPFQSMFLALCAELGTVVTYPIAMALGMTSGEAASVAMVGGADGPMVLYTSLKLAPHLFVPITVVAYLYLGLTYGGYPYLIKLLVPAKLRAIKPVPEPAPTATAGEKLAFAVILNTVLCFLFPVAAPLFISLFLGVAIKEAGLTHFSDFVGGPLLYGSTLFLGFLLGVLCEANTILSQGVWKLLILGVVALLLSGIGGILGGYVLYYLTGKKYNPVVGIAGVSCVPTCAKVAQKMVSKENPAAIILPQALGACISGVITTAILCGVYTAVIPLLAK
ncbi:MAG: sodium ion-translocating decarboxylase subunit beta [Lentisphaeria bacterium]|jgi:oxaloacetate decarboxylase beta subunit